jgi:hypothetical protein
MMTSSCMTLATPLFKSDRDKMDSLAKWTFRSTELTNITHWFPYFIPSQRRGSASDSDARRRRAVRAATGAMFPPQVAMWIPANARICLLDACNRKRRRHLTPRLRIILVTGLALFVRATTSVGLDNRSCLSSSCQLLIRTDPLTRIHQQSKAAATNHGSHRWRLQLPAGRVKTNLPSAMAWSIICLRSDVGVHCLENNGT